ncbi:MAG: hypothetical protein AB7I59_14340 [Geminicoccaceae bacterium]
MRTIRRVWLAAGIIALSSAAASAAEPTLKRVLLTTGGVGYFGYEAAPDAQGHVRLTVPLAQVDDLLKSLIVMGGDGRVRGVSLLGPTPLSDLFRDAPFGEGDLIDLPSLLLRLRGAEIEITGPATLRGRILAVAREEVIEDGRASARHRLSLAGADGIRSVILETVSGLSFTDPALRAQVDLVLARLAENGAEQTRELDLALGSAATAPVKIGYLAETPLWKASWRLVVGGDDGLLQGWAVLENASGQDWQDVAVTLVGGSPTALRQSLFARQYVDRPEFPGGVPMAKAAGRAEAAPRFAAAAPEPDMALADQAAPAALDTAAAQELAAQTLFPLPQPVTLAVGHTAMAPILDRRLPIERVALYRTAEGGRHPNAAIRLRNDGDASLPAGLATLYEEPPAGGLTFLGDAPLPQTAPGRTEMLAYGRDGAVEVEVRSETHGRIDRATVVDGVLEVTRVEQQRYRYGVDLASGAAARSFVLEEPSRPDWRLTEPSDAVVEGGLVRVTRPLTPGAPLEIVVALEQPKTSRLALLDYDAEALRLELAGLDLPPELRTALARLQELSGRVVSLEREIAAAEQRRGELAGDQERLRENLGAVPAGSDLARRYLAGLAGSEDALTTATAQLERLRTDLATAREARADYVRNLRL